MIVVYSEVHPVPTARRPLNRLSVAFFPFVAFRLNPPPLPFLSVSRRLDPVHKNQLLLMRSAEHRARRAEKERERRAAESPACRQSRLASVKAATRIHRQALESSIAENQHMRAEHCSQAAVVAEARCARRDATHSDAFEHLLWLHSCSGSLGVMNARRLSHLKHAGA